MTEKSPTAVVVAVPVYRGLQSTRDCLESLRLSELPESVSVLLIDDASPDPALKEYCQAVADSAGFELLVNDENLGFVKTVNRAFAHAGNADVILLNSDTVVSANWVQRLQASAYSDAKIGTATPLSNNGTICSYPVFLAASPLPESWTALELDRLCANVNHGMVVDLPTAVGFCVYIKRECLEDVGVFDFETFGHGYGEECDFSLRAEGKGWRNVVAADVFVYHEGGASFAEQAQPRKVAAEHIIAQLHPQYQAKVMAFIEEDPLAPLRLAIDAARLQQKPESGGEILAEQARHHSTMRDELGKRLAIARQDIEEELRQKKKLESMLQDCRDQFTATDKALQESHTQVSAQRNEMQALAQQLQDVSNTLHAKSEALEYAQVHVHDLQKKVRDVESKITTMENSRSWRYTAWLRREGS